MFANIVASENIRDPNVLAAIEAASLKAGADAELVYVTLLAVHILESVYKSEASEAVMIIAKAKTYCKQSGIRNPNAILKKFELPLRA